MTSKTTLYTSKISYLQDAGVTFTRTVVSTKGPQASGGVLVIYGIENEKYTSLMVPLTSIFDIEFTTEEI